MRKGSSNWTSFPNIWELSPIAKQWTHWQQIWRKTWKLRNNICCCLKIGKRKKLFSSNKKNQMSLYGYLSIKQRHMYRLKRRFSMHHILWAIQTKERTKKRRRRSFVLSWESFVEFFGWWRIKPYNMTFHLHVWFSYKIA